MNHQRACSRRKPQEDARRGDSGSKTATKRVSKRPISPQPSRMKPQRTSSRREPHEDTKNGESSCSKQARRRASKRPRSPSPPPPSSRRRKPQQTSSTKTPKRDTLNGESSSSGSKKKPVFICESSSSPSPPPPSSRRRKPQQTSSTKTPKRNTLNGESSSSGSKKKPVFICESSSSPSPPPPSSRRRKPQQTSSTKPPKRNTLNGESSSSGSKKKLVFICESSSSPSPPPPSSRRRKPQQTSSTKTPKRNTLNGESSSSGSKKKPVFICEFCIEPKMDTDIVSILGCTHAYCNDCIVKYVGSKLQENITIITCPVPECKGVLELEYCRSILPHEVFDKWDYALCEAMFVGSQKFYCPFKDCSAMLIDDRDREVIKEAECPNCCRLFCAKCKVPWHSEIGCEEFQKLHKDEREREDIMLMNLAQNKNWKRCPNCRIFVERSQGCKYVKCRCRTAFCYTCGSTNIDKKTHLCHSCHAIWDRPV